MMTIDSLCYKVPVAKVNESLSIHRTRPQNAYLLKILMLIAKNMGMESIKVMKKITAAWTTEL